MPKSAPNSLLAVLRRTPALLLLASAVFFGVSYFTVRFPEVEGAFVGSYLSTLAIALPSFAGLWRYLGGRRAAAALVALGAYGFVIETTGTVTGFPYGEFFYGDSLGPKLAGHVPYILPVSYAPLVIGAFAATAPAGRRDGSVLYWVLGTALLLTLVDGVLDPGAAYLGFWVWPEGGLYYGVPLSNYLGWLFSSGLAAVVLLAAGRPRRVAHGPPVPGMLDSLVLAVAFWVGVALWAGMLVPVVLGAVLFVYLLRRRALLRAARVR
ncbi:MAG: carotenoid biosynthesis protein [Rubrobacter sp.]|nr:carotenoid biosynthesis protein [Rubrobacter sp.]